MDLMSIATKLFMNKIGAGGGSLDEGAVSGALGGLLGGDGGGIDLGSIVSKLDGGGLMSMAQSWLGDGDNEGISTDQVSSLLGESQISEFASKLNLNAGTAKAGLAGMLPDLIDGNSKGGSILDAVGGSSGLLGMASKFLK